MISKDDVQVGLTTLSSAFSLHFSCVNFYCSIVVTALGISRSLHWVSTQFSLVFCPSSSTAPCLVLNYMQARLLHALCTSTNQCQHASFTIYTDCLTKKNKDGNEHQQPVTPVAAKFHPSSMRTAAPTASEMFCGRITRQLITPGVEAPHRRPPHILGGDQQFLVSSKRYRLQ